MERRENRYETTAASRKHEIDHFDDRYDFRVFFSSYRNIDARRICKTLTKSSGTTVRDEKRERVRNGKDFEQNENVFR